MGKKLNYVIGPSGSKLTLNDLPPPDTARWIPRKKAEIVAAVRGGLLSLEDARERYALTLEEFSAWQDSIDHFGLRGLRMTHTRKYRQEMSVLAAIEEKYEKPLQAV